MRLHHTIQFFFICIILAQVSCQPDWFNRIEGVKITSHKQFKDLIEGEYADKHVVIEFYMKQCHFCMMFLNDWNEIVKGTTSEMNDIVFMTIDGQEVHEMRRRYKIHGFPSFVYLEPNAKGKRAHTFDQERSKTALLGWIKDLILKDYSQNLKKDEKVQEQQKEQKIKEPRVSPSKIEVDLNLKRPKMDIKEDSTLQQKLSQILLNLQYSDNVTSSLDRTIDSLGQQTSLIHLKMSRLNEENEKQKGPETADLNQRMQIVQEILESKKFSMGTLGLLIGMLSTFGLVIMLQPQKSQDKKFSD